MRLRFILASLLSAALTACGGGGGGSSNSAASISPPATVAPLPVSSSPGALSNAMPVVVDLGISSNSVNQLFATVTLCKPGSTSQCQIIEHVMVDTGSTGLRILSSALAPGFNFDPLRASNNLPLLNCVQFIDNTYAWGPVASADVVLGNKTAASVPIQIIADPTYTNLSSRCSSGGSATPIASASELGANGILGLGLFKEDCGAICTNQTSNGYYFTCTNAACTRSIGTTASTGMQLKQPVTLFTSDNNGFLIDLPAVSSAGASRVTGSLIFGINTQTNNQLASAQVLTTDSTGYFTTVFEGRSLGSSFIDSGSNGLFFDSAKVPECITPDTSNGFYCPTSLTKFTATLVGTNARMAPVEFSIDNALSMFTDQSLAALPMLSGPIGDIQTFDWGLPFYYGRRVFMGISGQATGQTTGPFVAF